MVAFYIVAVIIIVIASAAIAAVALNTLYTVRDQVTTDVAALEAKQVSIDAHLADDDLHYLQENITNINSLRVTESLKTNSFESIEDDYVLTQELQPADVVAGSFYGNSVALSRDGQRLAVGAAEPGTGPGAVYVYNIQNGACFGDEVKLLSTSPTLNDRFGSGGNNSISFNADGTLLAVGTRADATGGSVEIFAKTGPSTWVSEKYFDASDDASTAFDGSETVSGDAFGVSLCFSDIDTLAVGASGVASNEGKVYVFGRDTGGIKNWGIDFSIVDPSVDAGDDFGGTVMLSGDGDTLAVGSLLFEGEPGIETGGVFVYRQTLGVWNATAEALLLTEDLDDGAWFSNNIGLSQDGNRIMVGASLENSEGIAVFFTRDGNLWTEHSIITSPAGANDEFGRGIALSTDGTIAYIGAEEAPADSDGATYIYKLEDDEWTFFQMLVNREYAITTPGNHSFGDFLAISGDGKTAVATDYRFADITTDLQIDTQHGAAFVFTIGNIVVKDNLVVSGEATFENAICAGQTMLPP